MFIIKRNYYFYIDSTKLVNLNLIKKNSKINFIYRPKYKTEPLEKILKFRKKCKELKINFFVSNNLTLSKDLRADGLYISAYNKQMYRNIKLIGSAHNFKEIYEKIKQGCCVIILSRLFRTNYKNKKGFYGIIKFNLICQKYKVDIIPLGGINNKNLLNLNLVKSKAIAILSAVKKKPAISNRLF